MRIKYCAANFLRPIRLALPLLAGLFLGCDRMESDQSVSGTPQAALEVGVVELKRQALDMRTLLPGRTSAFRIAEVRPQVSGILQKRLFVEGAQVEVGQQLYQIDPKPYQADFNRAKAELARAMATVSSVRPQEKRYARLVKENAVSQQHYDDVKARLDESIALVQAAKAGMESARINLDYTSLAAPIHGRISQSFVTEGALVTANQPNELAQVTQLDPIYVDITQSTSQMLKLRKEFDRGYLQKTDPEHAEVRLLLEDGNTYRHTGELSFSGVIVDESTSTITIRAVFPNPDQILLPGMFVRASLSEGRLESALLAPQQGIAHTPSGGTTAMVVDASGKVVLRTVQTRRAIDNFWLIDSGLEAGDLLIVSGLHKARPGAQVKPVAADIPNQPGT